MSDHGGAASAGTAQYTDLVCEGREVRGIALVGALAVLNAS